VIKLGLLSLLLFACNSKDPTFIYKLEFKNGAFRLNNNAMCETNTFDDKYKKKWCQKVEENFECEDAEGNKVSFREFQVKSMCESAISMKKREGVDLKD
jgi:hypothetical protein